LKLPPGQIIKVTVPDQRFCDLLGADVRIINADGTVTCVIVVKD
jgi:hypothetical protein